MTLTFERPRVSVIRHRRERRSKCSLSPLRALPGVTFHVYPGRRVNVEGHVRLSREGPRLAPTDAGSAILLLDGTWRLITAMETEYAHVPARSLPRLTTAYPRVSKLFDDPPDGLASIEALAVAFAIMGSDPRPLLATYRWGQVFFRENSALFGRWIDQSARPDLPSCPRNEI